MRNEYSVEDPALQPGLYSVESYWAGADVGIHAREGFWRTYALVRVDSSDESQIELVETERRLKAWVVDLRIRRVAD